MKDVILRRAKNLVFLGLCEILPGACPDFNDEILPGVYPEPEEEILPFVQKGKAKVSG